MVCSETGQSWRRTTVDQCECGGLLARGRHRGLPALRTLAPAPLLVLVLAMVLERWS